MTCDRTHEAQIIEYLDDSLPEDGRKQLQHHLASCVQCMEYFRSQERLDIEMVRFIGDLKLSDDFSARVLKKTSQAREPSPTEWIAFRKRQLEAEFVRKSSALNRRSLTHLRHHWWDMIGASVIGFAVVRLLAGDWIPEILAKTLPVGAASMSALLSLALISGAVGVWWGRHDMHRALRAIL